MSLRASAHTGVAISRILEHFHFKICTFHFFLGDRHTSGAPRSESQIPMIAGGNHSIMYCGLVRDDSYFLGLFLQSEGGLIQAAQHIQYTKWEGELSTGKRPRTTQICVLHNYKFVDLDNIPY